MSINPPGKDRVSFLATPRAARSDDDLAPHTRREIKEAAADMRRQPSTAAVMDDRGAQ